LAAAALLLLAAAPAPVAGAEEPSLRVGTAPPKVTLKDLQGFPVKIPEDVRGKVAIVHFWTDYCNFCLVEMPAMENLYQKYRGQGLTILAVNVGQKKELVKAFVNNIRVTYPVLLDLDLKVAGRYGVSAVPRTYFLDRKGVIRYRILGDATEEDLGHLIRSLL
jgi:peroxiredoxin